MGRMDANGYDVAVVGGGAAGMSAALVLGRALRRTLLVDAGEQGNLPALAVGGLLGFTGSPAELYAAGAAQLDALADVERRHGTVAAAAREGGGFVLTLAAGRVVRARAVVLATGMAYTPPALPGLAPLWGDTAFHCPFCHGHEVHGRPLAVLGEGEAGVEAALLLRGWSDDVVLLADGRVLPEGASGRLTAAGVRVEPRPVAALEHASADGAARARLGAVVFADGGRLPRDGIMVRPRTEPRDDLARQLGAATAEAGGVQVDAMGRTDVPGLYAAGDAALGMAQVSIAVAAGAVVAAAIVKDSLEGPAG